MNQNVFIELINPFKDKVFRLAKRLLTSTEEAEDATQEVMVKLWNKKENLEDYNNIEALAMTMTKNYCFDQLKSKRAGNLKIVHNNYTDREPQLDKKLEDSNSLEWVEKIISQLPEQLQILIQLRDVEQYEFEEIAKIVDMNETAIRVALSRARKKLENQCLIRTVMELNKIENILEKYFQGETTIAEENQLKEYFSSPNVAQHLEQYKPIFGYFSQVKEQKLTQEIPLQTKKRNVAWLSIAASVVVLLGIGTFYFVSQKDTTPVVAQSELGTYDNPEEALAATQKALALLSNNVNVGIESVHYINEYEQSKNKIFKQ